MLCEDEKVISILTYASVSRNIYGMVKCTIVYQGELRNELTHVNSGMSTLSDAPCDNHGKGESFSPTDLMCSALGACMATIMGIYAQQNNIDLRGMKIEVTKHMATDPRRIAKIETAIDVPLPADTPHRAALENCALTSPAMQSLHPDIEVPIVWRWCENA